MPSPFGMALLANDVSAAEREKNKNKPHITDQPTTLSNWYLQVNWFNFAFLVAMPIYAVYEARSTPLKWQTLALSLLYSYMTASSVMAGYHRLWSHTSYRATTPLKIYLACFGAGAVQGSIRWWARDHRAHHRFTDTDRDPYSVKKGFVYSHWGWLIMKQNPKRIGRCDITDLNEDWVVQFQHKYYLPMILAFGFLLPITVAGLGWGDWKGGFVYACMLRIWCNTQGTCCINSVAHWLGDQPFDDRQTPRDHFITALMTFGEGYHNFHHEFPSDFRSAIEWYQYDPCKWSIKVWKWMGLAYDLKQFRVNEIEKGRLQQQQKKLEREMAQVQGTINEKSARLDWGKPIETLPVMEWDDFVEESKKPEGRKLVAIAGIVHDVTEFIPEHPGGKAMIKSGIGRDATAMFNGGVYYHTNAAHNLLATMRVGVIRGGQEVEIWKKAQADAKNGDAPAVLRTGRHITKAREVPMSMSTGVAVA